MNKYRVDQNEQQVTTDNQGEKKKVSFRTGRAKRIVPVEKEGRKESSMFEGRLQQHVFWSPLPGTRSSSVVWTKEENKVFENSLVGFPEDAPDRWDRIASLLPGKTAMDVVDHYKALLQDVMDIEMGRIVLPGQCDDDYDFGSTGRNSFKSSKGKEERKKGIPWTEEEHRRFLDGLERYGKGDWRSISRNAVVTRTPTQVASHAQKYFIRLNSSGKRDKKRGSIHDTKPLVEKKERKITLCFGGAGV